MIITGEILGTTGSIIWGLLVIGLTLGKLRNTRTLVILSLICGLIFCLGIKYYSYNLPYYSNKNAAPFLFAPLIFILSYAFLRMIYKKIYGIEPDISPYSSFSSRDGRGLNFFDHLVAFIPSCLSLVVAIIWSNY